MKKLFKAIRNGDFNEVKEIITKKPELVNCVAKQPPKKDDGQSPLQVALKTGNFEIAKYLIEMGADLNFMEDESCCNEWRTPVIHDAITAAVMCSRWNTNSKYMGFKLFSTKERADDAFNTLSLTIKNGADVRKKGLIGINTDKFPKIYDTTLSAAAGEGHLGIVRYLIEKAGLSPDEKGDCGQETDRSQQSRLLSV